MIQQPHRVGIVGLGTIGRRLMGALQAEPRASIVAVCDTNAALAEQTAVELGGISWSTDYREMLHSNQVDLVYVAVPPKLHHAMVLDVIAAGKHMLCEKPLALTLREAQEMLTAARQAGVVHALNLPLHYHAGPRTFSRELQSGRIGALQRIAIDLVFPRWPREWQRTPWVGGREQGGAIREVCPHLFHQLLRNFGPVQRVLAHMEYPSDPQRAEDRAVGLLELASGQIARVDLLCNLPRPEVVSLTAYGSAGALGLAQWAVPLAAQDDGPLEPIAPLEPAPRGLIPNLLDALEGAPTDLCSFEDGVAIQQLLEAWEHSAQAGTWVAVSD